MIFDKKAQLLRLEETKPNTFTWQPFKNIWINYQTDPRLNLFSKVGVGARSVIIKLQKDKDLTLSHSIAVDGRIHFISDILQDGALFQEIRCVNIKPTQCTAVREMPGEVDKETKRPSRGKKTNISFPAVLTEKYNRYNQLEPQIETQKILVMVTNKQILLEGSDLVYLAGHGDKPYILQISHTLDEFQNEYEISRKVEL